MIDSLNGSQVRINERELAAIETKLVHLNFLAEAKIELRIELNLVHKRFRR